MVATKDRHPENHISFASNHRDKKPGDKVTLEGTEQMLWPDHCIQYTEGAGFADELKEKGAGIVTASDLPDRS